jgi:hypothetical protein
VRSRRVAIQSERSLRSFGRPITQLWLGGASELPEATHEAAMSTQRRFGAVPKPLNTLHKDDEAPAVPECVSLRAGKAVTQFVHEVLEHSAVHIAHGKTDGNDDDPVLQLSTSSFRACVAQLASTIAARDRDHYVAYAKRIRADDEQIAELSKFKNLEITKLQDTIVHDAATRQHQFQAALVREPPIRRCPVSMCSLSCGSCHIYFVTQADQARDQIGEITALRAKLARMRDEQAGQAEVVRERVKREYDDLVHSLFSTSFALKNRFEEYRTRL